MGKQDKENSKAPYHSDKQVLFFIVALCLFCSAILAIVSYSLQTAQTNAKEFDRSKQMLIATKILTHKGTFEILNDEGKFIPAKYDPDKKILVPFTNGKVPLAKDEEIRQVAKLRIRPLLTDSQGNVTTFEEQGIQLSDYIEKNKKTGYAALPFKLFYAVTKNSTEAENLSSIDLAKNLSHHISSIIIPISGFGLWAPIYGYIAIAPNGTTAIGTTWYEHGETPGLGANITEEWWQRQFYGKEIFQFGSSSRDLKAADLGITVVKGKVKDVYGNSPKSKNAVDGMSGATLTGDGVTAAYRSSLSSYRALLIKLNKAANG